jgi:SNF2 family DNA or RNA helicase
VVFTTYNLVASEFQSCSTDTSKESGGLKKRKAQFHPLFQVHWKRVILDEAHMIRNPDTAMSQGAAALTSDYRWCVTGTPIQNKELDLYALIRFLNLAPFNDRNIWREQVQKGSKGIQRMTALVKGLILRRMKTELGLDGKQLVELPPKDISLHQLALSSEEQAIHDAIFLHTKTTLETWLNKKQGESTTEQEKPKEVSELVKRMSEVVFDLGVISSEDPGLSSGYSFILALLLRIRQSCVHPNLLVSKKKPAMGDKINEEDTDFLSSHFQGLTLGPVPGGEEEEDSQKSPSKESKDLLQQFNIQFHSTRVNALMKELQKVRETAPNDKCVIFSQWTSMIDIIEYHLGQHGIGFERIDGQ